MLRHVSRIRDDERGVALITALLATMVMLALGLALLSIVDTQASESTSERSRDRAFNLSENVLNSQAFVLSRYWPSTVPLTGELTCNHADAGFGDIIGSTDANADAVDRLAGNLNASSTDTAFTGASWQVNMCDDDGSSTVWNDSLLTTQKNWDKNLNNLMWVRVQSTVEGKTRSLAGLVRVRTAQPFQSKFGLVAGNVNDDLGTTINNLADNVTGGVLSSLLGTTPTVAADPSQTATTPPSSGVTGLRCGALDMQAIPLSTCIAGTLGALGGTDGLPVINNLLTGGKLAQYPTLTTTTASSIAQLRAQAIASKTYYTSSAGSASTAISGAGATPACEFTTNTGTRSADTVVFIEKVGTGDQYCRLDVGSGVRWKALVIGSGRVIIRGNGATTAAPVFGVTPEVAQTNTFSGVVYGLNLQRHAVVDGGQDLLDAASPGREVVRIDNGAHVKGAVNTDGKSGRVGIYPPPLTVSTTALIDSRFPCTNRDSAGRSRVCRMRRAQAAQRRDGDRRQPDRSSSVWCRVVNGLSPSFSPASGLRLGDHDRRHGDQEGHRVRHRGRRRGNVPRPAGPLAKPHRLGDRDPRGRGSRLRSYETHDPGRTAGYRAAGRLRRRRQDDRGHPAGAGERHRVDEQHQDRRLRLRPDARDRSRRPEDLDPQRRRRPPHDHRRRLGQGLRLRDDQGQGHRLGHDRQGRHLPVHLRVSPFHEGRDHRHEVRRSTAPGSPRQATELTARIRSILLSYGSLPEWPCARRPWSN